MIAAVFNHFAMTCRNMNHNGRRIILKQKKVTFDDIAKYTGFSKTTISRYFNHPDSLTVENQDKIADALKELNYQENKLAKVLANGQSEFIGVIIPNFYLGYFSEMLNCILSTYEQFGYKFLVFIGGNNRESERKYIGELLAYKIEGLIVLSHTIPSKELASYNIPIVAIEREDEYVNSVNTNNYMGGLQATTLLYKNNCDVLLHINSDMPEDIPAYKRITGFLDICREHSLNHELILKDFGNSYSETKSCLEEVYQGKKKGIFLANDTHASIMLNLIFREYGRLPDEYRLVGFDDSPIAVESVLPISTVGQQIDKIAYTAVELLVEQMNERKKRRPEPQKELVHKEITPVLKLRDTTDNL